MVPGAANHALRPGVYSEAPLALIPGPPPMHTLLAFLLIATLAQATFAFAEDLNVGDAAPDFALQASDGKTYRLADFKGNKAVVLAWFPKAFTAGCTIECKSLAKNGQRIREYDVAYFMASVDALEDNTRFATETQAVAADAPAGAETAAQFPILSDPTKATARAYGVLGPHGFANRWTFYIDADGRIAHIDKDVNPATSAEDMIARLRELGVAAAE